MSRKRRTCILLVLAASIFSSAACAGTIDAIDAFGDSLTDVGNTFRAVGIPGTPYFNGQYSNGNVWIQDLALDLGLAPLTASLAGGTDYAVGDAQTGTTLYNTATLGDLPSQVTSFETANPGGADPNALYTIWIGANDLAAIPANATAGNVATDFGAIAGNIDTAIGTLAAIGAKHFLIVTVPDLGTTPLALSAGPAASAAASEISAGFDTTLVNGGGPIPSLSALGTAESVNISVLNTYALIDSIVADPAAFGLSNVTQACLTGVNYTTFSGGTPCATPNQFLFWDHDHPTAAGHEIVAEAALETVTPEPASISLIGCGLFGMCGLFLLRRRYCGNR